jgi:ribose-phosphate pyrophosphokinase
MQMLPASKAGCTIAYFTIIMKNRGILTGTLQPLVFSTQAYLYMQRHFLKEESFEEGCVEVHTFPDGERYQRVHTEVDNRDVILIGGTISDNSTLELYDLATALVQQGARSLTLVIPFFGYSTMERAVKPGEVITAKSRARLLSSIPKACFGNQVLMLDLHSEGLPHYFEGGTRSVHLYAKKLVMEAARRVGGSDFVLASTDSGRAKWVESLANDMGVDAAFVFKRRLSGNTTEVTSINADVSGRNVVIYDDMIRTGGSLINAAAAYRDAGAREISVVTTHGLFVGNAFQKIKNSGLFSWICSTDSHPEATKIEDSSLLLYPVYNVFLEHLSEDYTYGTV